MLNRSSIKLANQGFFSLALSQDVAIRAIKVALVVGTVLAFINHGDKILTMTLTGKSVFQILLTYLVPYTVSTWSGVRSREANSSKNT